MLENIEEENLKSFISDEIEKHSTIKEDLLSLMEEKENE